MIYYLLRDCHSSPPTVAPQTFLDLKDNTLFSYIVFFNAWTFHWNPLTEGGLEGFLINK